jgi:hypothetical protein
MAADAATYAFRRHPDLAEQIDAVRDQTGSVRRRTLQQRDGSADPS